MGEADGTIMATIMIDHMRKTQAKSPRRPELGAWQAHPRPVERLHSGDQIGPGEERKADEPRDNEGAVVAENRFHRGRSLSSNAHHEFVVGFMQPR